MNADKIIKKNYKRRYFLIRASKMIFNTTGKQICFLFDSIATPVPFKVLDYETTDLFSLCRYTF